MDRGAGIDIPRFIVSTGRCGSTLLGSLLGAHPSVLNLSEFFAALQPGAFPRGEITGARFWTILCQPQPAWTLALRHRIEPTEFAYPIDEGGRFNRKAGVPPILAVCLPTLSDDPERLYEEVEHLVPTFPPARIGAHYRALFSWLAERLGKPAWIERSAGSLAYAGDIASCFNDGKFVHLYRNGPETALSMGRHTFFRMAMVREMLTAALGHDALAPGHAASENATAAPPASLAADLKRLAPETFDRLAFWSLPIPPERFGLRWSAVILLGTRRLASLPASNVCHVSYDELVSATEVTLVRLLDFYKLPTPSAAWLTRASAQVKPRPGWSPRLTSEERERLRRACEPGERVLRRLRDHQPAKLR